jgi:PAS fold
LLCHHDLTLSRAFKPTEQHESLLKQLNQHVPQNVQLLLNEARKRAEKRHAKRIANRKSACTSRARKKALVKEMTELNTRLRRQAHILSLLPDLVIVMDLEGKITFCSAQVERVLRHSIDDLIGAKLIDIMLPESRSKLGNLVQELVGSEGKLIGGVKDGPAGLAENQNKSEKVKKDKDGAAARAPGDASANAVSDSSFPLSVVQVEAKTAAAQGSSDENENSDTSASNSKQPSSLTNSSLENSGSDDGTSKKDGRAAAAKKGSKAKKEATHSDSSNTSSTVSTDANNLLSANANLERNVRWHNKKMKDKAVAAQLRAGYKDDVIGADVTANNASARLSSLKHFPCSSSSEEDSGYRESNDSREETSSSEGDNLSEGNGTF